MSLKEEIYKRGFTIDSFADYSGICRNTLFNIFKRYKHTRLDSLEVIANGLDISVPELVKIIYEGEKKC